MIVTGSNAGVGYQLASLLYAKNATVYVAARSEEKAHKAIDQIKTKHPDSKGTLNFLKLDLADLSTIEATANEFLSKESRLDVLWNNAGIMTPGPNKTSAQGYELQYATNVLGPFLFTQLLLPILKRTAASSPKGSVRVSWAGSFAADSLSPKGGVEFAEDGGLKIHSKNGGGGPTEYGVSKAANYLLGREFGRRHGEDGVLHSVGNYTIWQFCRPLKPCKRNLFDNCSSSQPESQFSFLLLSIPYMNYYCSIHCISPMLTKPSPSTLATLRANSAATPRNYTHSSRCGSCARSSCTRVIWAHTRNSTLA